MKAQPHIRNRYLLLGDIVLIIISVLGSYVLRLELGAAFLLYLPSAYWMTATSLIIKPIIYSRLGLYRRLWLYASMQELKLISIAVTAASIVVSLVMISLFYAGFFVGFPRSVLVIDWLLSFLFVGGIRYSFRLLAERRILASVSSNGNMRNKRVLIIGAGDAGALVVRELQRNPQLNLTPIGFLDDNPAKQKQQIYGVPVIGPVTNLGKIAETKRVDEVIIAIPSAPGRVVRLVADICRKYSIPFRTMPGIYELIGGKVSVSRLREVDITDLLRREPTHLEDNRVGETVGGKIVMITGAGGSIGRELCSQVSRWEPSELILLGHGENSIFETLLEIQENAPSLKLHPVIADVRDLNRMQSIFKQLKPELVFHAAAHKHVPLMELNIEDAVTNNILGTKNVVNACLAENVERLVMISTDKAIQPTSVMGATKRIAEMIVLDAANKSGKAFSVVRFGNVLGSRGSVVPLFKRQIAQGGPVTITHPEMKRFFMTIPEAVYLVLQAASMGSGGETFVLNMGEQVRILDLAEDLIRLSGLEPGKDIEIVFTGIRPGEKLSEDLWDAGELLQQTKHPDISRLDETQPLMGMKLSQSVEEIIRLAEMGDSNSVMSLMDSIIPGSAVLVTPPLEITAIQ